ncbi:MAG TPA: hypothetical protein DCG33_04715 [Prevotellaceae bacterium]|nr:hypothetical protein [Prevotellaceae bacterium]
MIKFIKYCATFVLPFLIAAVPLEWMLRQVPNPYKYKYEWMQKNASDVEILIFGSSHTFFGVRPQFIKGKAFSLANVSQSHKEDYYLLKYWADRYRHLRTVIVPISYFTWFSQGLESGNESFRCRYYKLYMDCDLYPDSPFYNLELSHFGSAKGKVDKLFSEDTDPGCDDYGWGNAYKLSLKDTISWSSGTEAEAAVERHKAKDWNSIGTNYERIKEMAEFCKEHGIQLVLITTPCWHSYYDKLARVQLQRMYELTRKFQKDSGVLYLDYMRDTRFVADDFFDSNHLSDVGAEKFTKILDKDIKRHGRSQ